MAGDEDDFVAGDGDWQARRLWRLVPEARLAFLRSRTLRLWIFQFSTSICLFSSGSFSRASFCTIPLLDGILRRSGQVCINQQNPSASIGAIKSALRSLRKGMPLVIFPEGGRTRDGQLQPFLPGAFFLAIKAQAEIVPIALVGTFDLLPMNTYHIKSQPLEMRVGEPVATAGLTLADTESCFGAREGSD